MVKLRIVTPCFGSDPTNRTKVTDLGNFLFFPSPAIFPGGTQGRGLLHQSNRAHPQTKRYLLASLSSETMSHFLISAGPFRRSPAILVND